MDAPARARHLDPRLFYAAAAAVALFSAGFLLWTLRGFGGEAVTRAVDDLGEMVAAAAGGLLCVWAARETEANRLTWQLLGASALAWAAGELAWSVLEVGLGILDQFPSVADIGFLIAVPLQVAAVISLFRPERQGARVRVGLDAFVLAAALFLVSWLFGLEHVVSAHEGSGLKFAISLAYPAGDVVTLAILLYGISRSRVIDGGTALVSLGILALTVSDSAFSYLNEVGTFNTTPLDSGWVVGFLLIGLGALRSQVKSEGALDEGRLGLFRLVLPYLPLLAAVGLTGVYVVAGRPMSSVTVGTLSLIVLVVLVRQFSALRDVRRLSSELEISVDTLRRQEEQLLHRAFHDPLTGLANRELFRDRLEVALAQSGRSGAQVAIVFVDIDDFKRVNDSLGHEVGDALLVLVAERLRACIRPGDTAARLGGDEFAILLPAVDFRGAVEQVAERVLGAFGTPFQLGADTQVSVSVGTSVSTAPETRAADLLRHADIAMYTAKHGGKARRAHFQEGMVQA